MILSMNYWCLTTKVELTLELRCNGQNGPDLANTTSLSVSLSGNHHYMEFHQMHNVNNIVLMEYSQWDGKLLLHVWVSVEENGICQIPFYHTKNAGDKIYLSKHRRNRKVTCNGAMQGKGVKTIQRHIPTVAQWQHKDNATPHKKCERNSLRRVQQNINCMEVETEGNCRIILLRVCIYGMRYGHKWIYWHLSGCLRSSIQTGLCKEYIHGRKSRKWSVSNLLEVSCAVICGS